MERIACIMGGTSGIGRATAQHFIRKNWRVVAVGRGGKHASELKALVDSPLLTALSLDLCEWENVQKAAAIVDELGGCDLLVNAVGTIGKSGIQGEAVETWDSVMKTNLAPMFYATKALLDSLKIRRGNVINISSVCSFRPCTSISYSVSKAGVDMFTRVAAKELAEFGIRVNAVNPSVVRSNLQVSAGLVSSEQEYSAWIASMAPNHPLQRIGEPKDIVSAIDFLADDATASWITGAILAVDGGRGVA